MSRYLLLVNLLALSFLGLSQPVEYHVFPISNAIWRTSFSGYQVGYCTEYQDETAGDTIINGLIYSKIQRLGIWYSENPELGCVFVGHYSEYMGAFRNDSIHRKILFIPNEQSHDTLLYDFNLNLFDELPTSYLFDPNQSNGIVTQIDSILLGDGFFHRRYQINIGIAEYVDIIEGIGSLYGLLSTIEDPFEMGSYLHCFIRNGVIVYQNQETTVYPCNLIDKVNHQPAGAQAVSIAPNPVIDMARVILPPIIERGDLYVFDILGTEKMVFKTLSNDSLLDFSGLMPGIYVYRFFQGRTMLSSGKIIKM